MMPQPIKRVQRHFFMLLALSIACACSPQTTAPNQTAATPKKQQEPKAKVESGINAIPTFEVLIEKDIEPLPLPPGGLRFQLDQDSNAAFQYHKPIGDGKFGPDGSLYLSFPTRHVVVRFVQPDFRLEFFGDEQAGGRDQPIANPVNFSFWDEKIQVTNTQKGQVMVFNQGFDMETFYQIHIQDPIPGPENQFLIRSDKQPNTFFRASRENKIRSQYMVPTNPAQSTTERLLFFDIQPNWDIVAANHAATDLYHLKINGQFRRHFQLNFQPVFADTPLEVSGLQRHGDAYWLLLQAKSEKMIRTFLVAITLDGTCRFFWETPFFSDGFHLDHSRLVLFERKTGKAQVFRR